MDAATTGVVGGVEGAGAVEVSAVATVLVDLAAEARVVAVRGVAGSLR